MVQRSKADLTPYFLLEIINLGTTMSFSEKIKLIAKRKSSFRCCICHKPFVEIHHIIPQEDGGKDTIENAAPLCSSCHDLYGGNPEKRKIIRQMRDKWWDTMAQRDKNLTENPTIDEFCEIVESSAKLSMTSKSVILYHAVFDNEDFAQSANHIHKLLLTAQKNEPNKRRRFYLDIDGHKNKDGGYDHDMFELQRNFLLSFLIEYFTEINLPFGKFVNKNAQNNLIPETIEIFDNSNPIDLKKAIEKEMDGIFIADKDKLIKL